MQRPQWLKVFHLRWIASQLTFANSQFWTGWYLSGWAVPSWDKHLAIHIGPTHFDTLENSPTQQFIASIHPSHWRITKMQIMLHIEDTPKMSLTCQFFIQVFKYRLSHGLLVVRSTFYVLPLIVNYQWCGWYLRLLRHSHWDGSVLTTWIYLTLLIIFWQLRILYSTPHLLYQVINCIINILFPAGLN